MVTTSRPTLFPASDLCLFFTKSKEALAASQVALSIQVSSTSFQHSTMTSTSLNISSLTHPLSVLTMTGLTCSQSLFSILTSINVHALSIETSNEFFLFMDMRVELGWVSYNMTSHRWVLATVNYNSRLEALNLAKNIATIPKHPCALIEHLGAIETKIALCQGVVDCTSGVDIPIEYEVFTKMLGKQTTIDQDGTILFQLFDFTIPPSTPNQLIVLCDSCKHLCLDCLSG